MKKLFIPLLALFILLLSATDSMATLKIKFRVLDDAENIMKGMTVRLYDRNDIIEEIQGAGSLVKFDLDDETIYTIEIELKGFVTKRIMVLTEKGEKDTYSFEVILERVKDIHGTGVAGDVLEYPISIIEYDSVNSDYNYNEDYGKSTRSALERLHEAGVEIKF